MSVLSLHLEEALKDVLPSLKDKAMKAVVRIDRLWLRGLVKNRADNKKSDKTGKIGHKENSKEKKEQAHKVPLEVSMLIQQIEEKGDSVEKVILAEDGKMENT
ncbi:hypothetical protein HPP92_028350 [Vanilla planifolia]|uniref:Uncharacterized protein n=1 Tax=Vanilla planifolia TaxID=51239 RepID=A0A835U3W5_VANPL|nr:hypothetical protein HPP92_028350 [Vanilla planifolia]